MLIAVACEKGFEEKDSTQWSSKQPNTLFYIVYSRTTSEPVGLDREAILCVRVACLGACVVCSAQATFITR